MGKLQLMAKIDLLSELIRVKPLNRSTIEKIKSKYEKDLEAYKLNMLKIESRMYNNKPVQEIIDETEKEILEMQSKLEL